MLLFPQLLLCLTLSLAPVAFLFEKDEGEMIQCCLCEDWYHDNHLGLDGAAGVPAEYEEMICVHCVKSHTFLLNYPMSAATHTPSTGAHCSPSDLTPLDL